MVTAVARKLWTPIFIPRNAERPGHACMRHAGDGCFPTATPETPERPKKRSGFLQVLLDQVLGDAAETPGAHLERSSLGTLRARVADILEPLDFGAARPPFRRVRKLS